jgi:gliding motility-associated-like protein
MLRHLRSFIIISTCWLLASTLCYSQETGLIINEFSNGPSSSTKEYVELLVIGNPCETVDIRGWVVDDNNGDFSGGDLTGAGVANGHFRFSTDAQWSALSPGTIIVVFNASDKNSSIPANDLNDSNNDDVFIIPTSSSLLEFCDDFPSSSTSSYLGCTYYGGNANNQQVGLRNGGDAIQTRKPDYTYFHGLSYGSDQDGGPDGLQLSSGGSNECHYFNDTDYRDIVNFSNGAVPADETPGTANNALNLAYINALKNATGGTVDLLPTETAFCAGEIITLAVGDIYDTYLWSNGETDSSIYVSMPGEYWLKITQSGCESIDTIQVTLSTPTVNAGNDLTLCIGDSAILNGITNTTNYAWSANYKISDTTILSPTIYPLIDTVYYLQVIDGLGCIAYDSVLVTINNLPTLIVSATPSPVCEGEQTRLQASGALTYQWTPSIGIEFPDSNNTWATITDTITYALKGIDINGCSASESITINTLPKPSLLSGENVVFCDGGQGTILLIFEETTPYTIAYSRGPDPTSNVVLNSDTLLLTSDSTVVINLLNITDAYGCTTVIDTNFTITELALPTIVIPEDTTLCPSANISLPILFQNAIGYSYTIKDEFGTSTTFGPISADSVQHTFTSNGQYIFTSLSNGVCTYAIDDTLNINFYDVPSALISNATNFCKGDSALVTINFTGNPSFTISYYNSNQDTFQVNTSNDTLVLYFYDTDVLTFYQVADDNCSKSLSTVINLNQIQQPQATITGDALFCENDSAFIQFNFSGANPYNFNYTVNGIEDSASNYLNNTFSFYVSDSSNVRLIKLSNSVCDSSFAITHNVIKKSLPTATINGTDSICPGDSSFVQITFTGTPPYNAQLQKDGTFYQSILSNNTVYNVYTGIAGTYTVTNVSDQFCDGTASGSFQLHLYQQENLSLSTGSNFCDGDSALVIFTFSGRLPWDLYYEVNGQADSAKNIASANYSFYLYDSTTVSATEAIGFCKATLPNANNFIAHPLPEGNTSGGGIVCSYDTLPPVTFNVTNKVSNTITYYTPGGIFDTLTTNASITINPDQPGNYGMVKIVNAYGCETIINDTVWVAYNPDPIIDAGNDALICANDNIIIGTPAIVGQTYFWNTSQFLSDSSIAQPTITNNSANETTITYVLTATLDGCSKQDSLQVRFLEAISATVVANNLLCYGDSSGSISISASNGAGGYLYDISGNDPPADTNAVFNNLTKNDYSIVVSDSVGCKYYQVVSLSQPDSLVFSIKFNHPVCQGDTNGLIAISPEGGTIISDYNYDINGTSIFDSTITGLTDGTYTVLVSDNNGCFKFSDPITLITQSVLTINDITIEHASCYEKCDGEVEIDATAANLYTLDLTNNTQFAGFINVCAGNHLIQVEDTLGCIADTNFIVFEPDKILINPGKDTTICIGGEATYHMNPTGGNKDYKYRWEFNASTTDTAYFKQIGTYQAFVQDSVGCSSDTISFTVSKFDSLLVHIDVNLTNCQATELELTAIPSGGLPAYTFVWTKDNDPSYSNSADKLTVQVSDSTKYRLTLSDVCETPIVIDSVDIKQPVPPIVAFDVPISACAPSIAILNNTSETHGKPYTAVWKITGENDQFTYDNSTVDLPDPTCKEVTLYLYNELNCEFIGPTELVCALETPTASFTYKPNTFDIFNTQVNFSALIQENTNYSWFEDTSFVSNEIKWQTTLVQDSTTFCLVTINFYTLCTDTRCANLVVEDRLTVYVPNAFTPNKDGLNELFVPIIGGARPGTYYFAVFNRWGELIFESSTIGEGWDGTYKNTQSPNGVYSYRVYVKEVGTALSQKNIGSVSLIR